MNLHKKLEARLQASGPIGIGVIGCGKFATMFLAQAKRVAGFKIVTIVDLDPSKVTANLARAGWSNDEIGSVTVASSAEAIFDDPAIEVMIEATGDAPAGVRHALAAIASGKHCVMVNVEADVLAGPALAKRAAKAGVVYSQAYGDQPALIAEMIDWVRVCGFPIVAAGKGTKHMPHYHYSTPNDVWQRYGIEPERAEAAGMNPQMFNSFLDGTKSAIEMAAVANASGLGVPEEGLLFPPSSVDDLAQIMANHPARREGGFTEVVSCLDLDGNPIPGDLRWGVFVVFEAPSAYARDCFAEYGLVTDRSGTISALYRPYHLIGLELGISVANAAIDRDATGTSSAMIGDVVATAKSDLEAGTMLDGEGGHCVFGRLHCAKISRDENFLPIGLASGVRLVRSVARGEPLTFGDVEALSASEVLASRTDAMLMA